MSVVFTAWFLVIGTLLIGMALAGSVLQRLPLSTAMMYLGAGVLLGPVYAGMIDIEPVRSSAFLERMTEIAVIISLFTAGLKLRAPMTDALWLGARRLASVAMVLSVAAVAFIGVTWLELPLGAAVLLGALLAPTDPVLAADVQVENQRDPERVRFSLTGEAGMNDGTAFPFVMLGLGLLGLHELGPWGVQWLLVDVVWAIVGGAGVGVLCGTLVGRLVLYLRREHREALGLDDFLGLGLIALSYGLALLLHAYGFLAVFTAGLALRRIERQHSGDASPPADVLASQAAESLATDPDTAPAYMAQAVLQFNEHLERIGVVAVVLLVGAMLDTVSLPACWWWFVPLLFLVVRPLVVAVTLTGTGMTGVQRVLIGWFGVRGVGSLYYLAYAIEHGLDPEVARTLSDLTLVVIATSIVAHGISVTPLMQRYGRRERPPPA